MVGYVPLTQTDIESHSARTEGPCKYTEYADCIPCRRVRPTTKKKTLIGLMCRVFANGPRDLGSIRGRVIPKTLNMLLDTSLLNTLQHKLRIKGKVEQFKERSNALPYSLV